MRGFNQNDETLLASTERSSSTYVSDNHLSGVEHTGDTPSTSHLKVDQDDLIVSSSRQHIPLLRYWKWEILSIVASLGLLAGIFGTLARYNHGQQPEWPYNININSLISVLTAVIIAQLGFILAEGAYHRRKSLYI